MRCLFAVSMVILYTAVCFATIFGSVRGVVHDSQHLPLPGSQVVLSTQGSDWTKSIETDARGEFQFDAVPVGEYALRVTHKGFREDEQHITVSSAGAPVVHFALQLGELTQTVKVEVWGAPEIVNPESSTTESIISHREIARLPGAERTNSLAMIVDLIPGANLVHDQLHIRGGHQVSWMVDGVPIPNTNIASNVGPQLDPKDIGYVEVQRGGYSPEYGDRAYAVLNVVPHTGFERNNDCELTTSYGSDHQSNDQLSLGGHTQRIAYYTSVTGYRTDLGLQTPTDQVLHDLSSGLGGFTSLIFNPTPRNQLRLAASVRGDHYQVPNTAEAQALGIRDVQDERDAFVNFSWVRTLGHGMVATFSPILHRNRAAFKGGAGDTPVIPDDDRTSLYAGGQVTFSLVTEQHMMRFGFSGIAQQDNQFFGLQSTDGSALRVDQRQKITGNLEFAFVEDRYKLTSRVTLNAGARLSHFSGLLAETTASPRVGLAFRLPRNWVLRGFYGRYYQPPPLSTIAGSLLNLAVEQGFDFLPLRGERDEQKEIGLTIPFRRWAVEVTHYHTNAHNYFDHDVLGNSNIFFPLTIASARLRGNEVTVQSPLLWRRAHLHISYSRQYAEGQGIVTGGLTDLSPPESGLFYLDHDQRDTFSVNMDVQLPWDSWVAANVNYGSGFLDGDGPGHLSNHTTLDLSLRKALGRKVSVQASMLNIANGRYLLDNSNTFGGTHYNYPREIFFTVRYRFHY
jgi:outer membrane receptor for ferrienterochelin and colicin